VVVAEVRGQAEGRRRGVVLFGAGVVTDEGQTVADNQVTHKVKVD